MREEPTLALPLSPPAQSRPARRLFLVAARRTATNAALLRALSGLGLRAELLRPSDLDRVAPADLVLGRLDVMPTLDGVEPGLWALRRLERRGIQILNRPEALLASHDKLMTTLRLGRLDIPHPRTWHLDDGAPIPGVDAPAVVKPRFGSWGRDVVCCETPVELERCLRRLRDRAWFQKQGALVQELVPPARFDLRLIVAQGEVVGAIKRVAAAGEWRTNISLGGTRQRAVPSLEARSLEVAAAGAVGGDLVGVDLLPDPSGSLVVLEVNGAVDFTVEYAFEGQDVFEEVARALAGDPLSELAVRAG